MTQTLDRIIDHAAPQNTISTQWILTMAVRYDCRSLRRPTLPPPEVRGHKKTLSTSSTAAVWSLVICLFSPSCLRLSSPWKHCLNSWKRSKGRKGQSISLPQIFTPPLTPLHPPILNLQPPPFSLQPAPLTATGISAAVGTSGTRRSHLVLHQMLKTAGGTIPPAAPSG